MSSEAIRLQRLLAWGLHRLPPLSLTCWASVILAELLIPGPGIGATCRSVHPGATYYVDALSGDDANTGTSPQHSWRTLTKVNSTTFHPGDRILFKSGSSWTGQLWPKGSGTAEHPIVIDKYGDKDGGDAKPVINGAGVAEDAVLLKNQEYWEICNLEITNTGAAPAARRGVHLVAENSGELRHIYLQNLTIHDVNGIDSDKVNGGIHYSAIGDIKPSRFVDLRIEGNHISHVDRSGIFGWSTHWVRSKWYPSLSVVIRNNALDDIGGDGIVAVATDGALIEHNVVSRANQRSEGYNVGIWPWSADNTIVQFNEVYATRGQRDGEGFDSDWNSRNTLIQYNYSHDNDGGFLLVCNEGGHDPNENAGNIGTVVRYNISQNDHNRGITVSGPVTSATIYNNTIYVRKNENVSLLLQSDWGGWANGTYLYNNIFYVEGIAQFSYGVSRSKKDGAYVTAEGFGSSKDTVFDSNVYFGKIKAPEADSHALTSDPLLVNPGSAESGLNSLAGYGLRSGSPAIDSGRTVSGNGGRDFLGNPVPACRGVDRGAIEAVGCGKQ
jgi:parallel beta helix pectate lyase-like protein